nr:hypothetical protein [Tanacetum cinerariifolium]
MGIRDRRSFPLPWNHSRAVMLRVFPITLSEPALRWKNRLFVGLITTWDLLEKAVDDEWIKKFIENIDSNIRALKTITKSLQEKADQLTQTTLTNLSERVKKKKKIGKKDMEELVPRDLPVVQPYVPPTLFPGHYKKQKDNPYKTREIVGIPKKIHTKKAQEDEGDMDDSWDIMIKDIERLRQILIPTIHALPNFKPVVQPYMPRGPVRNEVKVVREKELEYDIPL